MPSARISVSRATSGPLEDVKLSIYKSTWEELPTLHNVVNGLATLQPEKVLDVYIETWHNAGDCGGNKRVD